MMFIIIQFSLLWFQFEIAHHFLLVLLVSLVFPSIGPWSVDSIACEGLGLLVFSHWCLNRVMYVSSCRLPLLPRNSFMSLVVSSVVKISSRSFSSELAIISPTYRIFVTVSIRVILWRAVRSQNPIESILVFPWMRWFAGNQFINCHSTALKKFMSKIVKETLFCD